MRRRLAHVLLVLGAAAVAASLFVDAGPRPRRAGPERPITGAGADPGDIRSNNSPALDRNPRDARNLAVANRIDTPRYSCALHVSRDGGRTWSDTPVPIPRGEQRKCYAPDVAFAADGTLHLLYVTLRGVANAPSALWLATSRDGGRTLGAPVRVSGPLAFQPRLAIDPADPRRLYAAWLQARDLGVLRFTGPGNPIVVTRSGDAGRTWSEPVRASAPARGRVLAPVPAVGPGGVLYVLHLDVGDDRLDYEGAHDAAGGPPYPGRFALVLARSRDAGGAWAESVVDDRIAPVGRFVAFLPPSPSLAVDRRSGRVYAAFHDARLGDADVYVWTLEAGAGGWSAAVRVNDTPRRDGTTQHLPRVAVAPDGRVDVLYYDRRADVGDRRVEISLQSSDDHGRSFGRRAELAGTGFDSRIGANSERGLPDLGSRLGLVADADGAAAVWTDTRWGSAASNKQDLVFATARVSKRSAVRQILRLGGLAAVLGGAIALGIALHRRSTVRQN